MWFSVYKETEREAQLLGILSQKIALLSQFSQSEDMTLKYEYICLTLKHTGKKDG